MKILIAGSGQTAYFLAREFISKGHRVMLVVHDEAEARALSRRLKETLVIIGNGSRMKVLDEAGARRADVFVALMPHDQDNLIACQIAGRALGVPRTVALVNDPEHEDVFRQLGVSVAISATQVVSKLIEEQTIYEDIVNLLPLAGGRIMVTDIILRDEAPVAGKQLAEVRLPEDTLVGCILRGDAVIVPRGERKLLAGDRLLLISTPEHHGPALRTLTGEEV